MFPAAVPTVRFDVGELVMTVTLPGDPSVEPLVFKLRAAPVTVRLPPSIVMEPP